MFGLGWAEIMVVGIVALIVIGPKELPIVFRKVGQFVGKAKGMARDFSSAMHDAAEESGMEDAMESMNSITDTDRWLAIQHLNGKILCQALKPLNWSRNGPIRKKRCTRLRPKNRKNARVQ